MKTQSIYRVEGSFTGCTFATAPVKVANHNNLVRASDVRFERCDFAIAPRIGSPQVASSLYAYFERPEDHVHFVNSRFHAAPDVRRGSFLLAGGRAPSGLLELTDCETTPALDHVVEVPWRAAVHLSGGTLRAKQAMVLLGPRGKSSKVTFADKARWSAPVLIF